MHLVNVINQPADLCFGRNDVFIGPTAIELSAIDEAARLRDHLATERKILAAYRHHDHRGYRSNRSFRYF